MCTFTLTTWPEQMRPLAALYLEECNYELRAPFLERKPAEVA